MAGYARSIRKGFNYQDLYGWYRVLALLQPGSHVIEVAIEDPTAGHFDDVTIRPDPAKGKPSVFIQVKFHDAPNSAYSIVKLMEKTNKGSSLLQKAWTTWQILRQESTQIELLLASTWAWDHRDPIASHLVDRYGRSLSEDFITGAAGGTANAARHEWWAHLGSPDNGEFEVFLGTLRFQLTYADTRFLEEIARERMAVVGLKHEPDDLRRGQSVIFEWIDEGVDKITVNELRQAIEDHDLWESALTSQPAVSLYLHTITKTTEASGDFDLDWRELFEDGTWVRGHKVLDPASWNDVMLPQLQETQAAMERSVSTRLLRARGAARLSAWLAVGALFSRVRGWTIEMLQGEARWRNDADPSDLHLNARVDDLAGSDDVLAVGVSIAADVEPQVRAYLARMDNPAGRLLNVWPSPGIGTTALGGDTDATRLAEFVRSKIREVGRPKRLLLFYAGPAAGAAFIGAQLNALAQEIQIHEDLVGDYNEAFTLQLN